MYLAIDIGGTKTLVARYDNEGNITTKDKLPTNTNYSDFLDELSSAIKNCESYEPVAAIGIAAPGHVEDENGIVEGFGNLDWKDVDIKGDLKQRFNYPIILDNDANMGAIGEAVKGAGRGKRKVLYVTVSTGIGTGVAINGKVSPVMKESEGGHMVFKHDGKQMAWEDYASGKAFYERYGKQGKDVDDPKIWEEFSDNLAQGLWDLMAMVQPDVVVVGGSMGVHFPKYGQFLTDAISGYSSKVVDHPNIVQAQDPENAVINGCYIAAKDHAEST